MKKKENNLLERKEVKISMEQISNGLNEYLNYRKSIDNSKSTIDNVNKIVNRFIIFCKSINKECMINDTIHKYVLSLNDKQKSTIDKYLKTLKLFFRYLYEQNITEENLELLFPKTKYLVKSKIPFYWNKENIDKLLKVIDRDTDIGKRDYAIFLIIINLGLRSGDIIRLSLDDIDWNNNQINFYQHKTSQIQCLPLLPDIGNALLEYLLNVRSNAKTDSRTIFLNNDKTSPIKDAQTISKILYKYEKKANIIIDKSFKNGVHSFRNTLAYNLLMNECSLDTISQVLGHVNSNTARIYLKINLEKLKECVLDWRKL